MGYGSVYQGVQILIGRGTIVGIEAPPRSFDYNFLPIAMQGG